MGYLSGFHAIEERIKAAPPGQVGPLLVAKAGPRERKLVDLAAERKVRINRVGTHELDRLAPDHRGIALYIEDSGTGNAVTLAGFFSGLGNRQDALAVILDEITDPHNYGAILRSCDQFGVDLVVTRTRRVAKHAEIVSKTSAGADSWVPVAETANLSRAVESLKEARFWIYGADMAGDAVWSRDLRGRTAIILGGEGTGLSRLLKERCDGLVAIPSRGRIDSLNVSVAAGVLLYEINRQRGQK
ncbi:MAG: 23S rRNA (guanosine(2251)-2'-O)-methyltransferase RlmB [Treponema sp.]|jgi:23S rRNA (guanosine2251-2'-O)-methyltransferase|nr:23S rRNA (guanosine(2251)-2'-O)-methyltransferase RlmB [Treponema sp.]